MSDLEKLEELEERLQRLEAEARALEEVRAAGRVLFMAEIVDEEGRTRAMLATGHGGTVSLNLLDQERRPRAALGLMASGPAVFLLDEQGTKRLEVQLAADGSPGVILREVGGQVRIDASVVTSPTLGLLGSDGAAASMMFVAAEGSGAILARDG